MANESRDDFLDSTRQVLARRVNYHCSNPDCRASTVGPHTDPMRNTDVGIAAHITAAAPLGKRYDAFLTREQRRHANNGIWLCTICGKLIDDDAERFPITLLREWKSTAEAEASATLGKPLTPSTALSLPQFTQMQTHLNVSTADASVKTGDEVAQQKIDDVKQLLKNGHFRAAKETLIKMRVEHWGGVSDAMCSKIANNEGVAAFNLDDVAGAERYFREALTYETDSAKVLTNLAGVELFFEKSEEALIHSARAHELAPDDENAASAYIQALYKAGGQERLDKALAEEPWMETCLQCRAALAGIAYERGEYGRSQELAQSIVETVSRGEIGRQMYFLLASALVKPIHTLLEQDLLDIRSLGMQERQALRRAEEAYTQIVNMASRDEGRNYFYAALVSRSGVRQTLGRFAEAILDCDLVLAEQADNQGALENKGRALLRLDRAAEAATWLEKVTDVEAVDGLETVGSDLFSQQHRDELLLLLGTAYLHSGQYERVLQLIGLLDAESDGPEGIGKAELRLLAAAQLGTQTAQKVETETVEYLQAAWAESPRAEVILARYKAYQGDDGSALVHYQRAVDLANTLAKDIYRYDFARYLYSKGRFDQALPLIRSVVDRYPNHPCLSMLALCLYNLGEYPEAREVAARARGAGDVPVAVSEVEAEVLEKGRDLEKAATVWKELIAANPQDYRYQMRLAFVEEQRRDVGEARRIVEQIPYDGLKEDVDLLINMARLRRLLGLPETLRYAYRARRIAYEDAQSHADYVFRCMDLEGEELDTMLSEHEAVQAGDAVYIQRNGTQIVYILEDEEPYRLGELSPIDRRTSILIGSQKGEKVNFNIGSLGAQEYEITEIKTKYLHANHETQRLFAEGQLEHPRIQVGTGDAPESLEQIKELLNRQSGGIDYSMMYRTLPMPFSTYTRHLGRSVLEVWLSVLSGAGGQIYAFGDTIENSAQIRLLDDDEAFVSLDLTALMTIVFLSIENVVQARFQRILLAQSVVDELRQYKMEAERDNQPVGIMGSAEGQLFYIETPKEYTDRKKEIAGRLLDFVGLPGVEVVTPATLLDMDDNYRTGIGDASLAAAISAFEKGALFYTDDFRLRRIAEEAWYVKGIDTKGFLYDLQRRNLITQEFFDQALAKLDVSGYAEGNMGGLRGDSGNTEA
jgi:tetratricopeptide (TPR) repeat protein